MTSCWRRNQQRIRDFEILFC